jgi:hypothetical protein
MNLILAAMVVAFAQTTPASSDGENANRLRASIYDIVQTNQTARLGTARLGDTRAEAPSPPRRPAAPARMPRRR